jgi:23S rRNA-/tRNA-specific pseudouridylate synthase
MITHQVTYFRAKKRAYNHLQALVLYIFLSGRTKQIRTADLIHVKDAL